MGKFAEKPGACKAFSDLRDLIADCAGPASEAVFQGVGYAFVYHTSYFWSG